MSVLNIRGIDDGLMVQVKAAAALRGMPLRSWVVEVLEAAVGGTVPAALPVKRRVDAPQSVARIVAAVQAAVKPETTADTRCRFCDAQVQRDPRNAAYWYCQRCRKQLDSSEVTS